MPVVAHVRPAGGKVAAGESSSDAAVGTLAHRLFAAAGDPARLRARASAVAAEAGLAADDPAVARAIDAARALHADPRARRALDAGRAWFEVPFSRRLDPHTILRGSIDCLVRDAEGRLTVIELKTGGRRDEHDAQLAVYVEAVRAMFPGAAVTGLLVYAGTPERGGASA